MAKVRRIDFSPDEWLGGTVALSLAERGLYITACALMYSAGSPIPIDHLRAACRDHGHTFNAALKRLLDLGKLVEDEGLISNRRVLRELQSAVKRSSNGSQNVFKRWSKPRQKEAVSAENNNIADDPVILARATPSTIIDSESTSVDSGRGRPRPASTDAPLQPDPVKEIFDRGLAILGTAHRSLLGKARKQYGDFAVLRAISQTEAEQPSEPVAYFVGCCEHFRSRDRPQKPGPATTMLMGALNAARKFSERQEAARNRDHVDDPHVALLDRRGDDRTA